MAETHSDITTLPTIGLDQDVEDDHAKKESLAFPITKEKDVESGDSICDDAESDEGILSDARDLVTHVISVDDDPSLNCWTFRVLVIGVGLSVFGGVLAEIYYFKPQTVLVSQMFLAIIAYVLGLTMETFIPTKGFFRYLNPGPFNKKENAMIVIMASAAANSALGTEVLAVQRLFYDITPNPTTSIFMLFSSQMIGYGLGGLMRSILLYPSKMLYPGVLPLISMFDAFFEPGTVNKKRLKLFYIAFFAIFVWELFPEWIFPLLTGFSVFCLADQSSPDFTRVFGGTNGNEGLGLLSVCFDWQYISGGVNPFAIPLQAQFSNLIGYILCMVIFCAVFYENIWKSRNFPFLSQELFYENGSVYDQLLILNDKFEVDPTLLAEQGLPFYAGSWVIQLLTTNLGMSATFTHLMIYNRSDLAAAWSWMAPSALKEAWTKFDWKFWQHDDRAERRKLYEETSPEALKAKGVDPYNTPIDPHYRETLKYADAPNSWYLVTLILSALVSLIVIYKANSTLPWWGFLISLALASGGILFYGALYAITGFAFIIQPFVQMIGGFIHPGKPMANMYFVLYSYNSVSQAQLLLRDLKIAQYAKLPPRASFTAQTVGTLLGAVLNYVLMNSIINNQSEILLSVEGTNIWSGQQPQQYNSQAVAWGGLSHELFAAGKIYDWVPYAYLVGFLVPVPFYLIHLRFPALHLDYVYTPVICYFLGWLCVGINSSILSYFAIAWLSQWWLRTRYPRWFVKYNYILGAALDGGTQVMVFILSFAVFGAAGTSHLFPQWWGANQGGNYDRCVVIDD